MSEKGIYIDGNGNIKINPLIQVDKKCDSCINSGKCCIYCNHQDMWNGRSEHA